MQELMLTGSTGFVSSIREESDVATGVSDVTNSGSCGFPESCGKQLHPG